MILSSDVNLQIGGILGCDRDKLIFRLFIAPEEGKTIMGTTFLVTVEKTKTALLRKIDEEVTSIVLNERKEIYALGHFGNLFVYNGIDWQDLKYRLTPGKRLTKMISYANEIIAIGSESTLLKLGTGGWISIDLDSFGPKRILFDICSHPDGSFFVAGGKGLLLMLKDGVASVIDVPTNKNILAVTVIDNGDIAFCGTRGILFIGKPGYWKDYSQPELGVNFTDLNYWNGKLYVSAKKSVMMLKDDELTTVKKLNSFKFFSAGDFLWTTGIRSTHYFDGVSWTPYEVVLDLDDNMTI